MVLYFVDDSFRGRCFRAIGSWPQWSTYLSTICRRLAIDWSPEKVPTRGDDFCFRVSSRFLIIVYSFVPSLLGPLVDLLLGDFRIDSEGRGTFMYLWLALSMLVVSYVGLGLGKNPKLRSGTACALLLGGYGSLLCATLGAYVKELVWRIA